MAGSAKTLRALTASLLPAMLCWQASSFLSSIALARVLGATTETDAYFLAASVSALVQGVLLIAVQLGAIPALTEIAKKGNESYARSSSELLGTVFVASFVVYAVASLVTIAVLPLAIGAGQHELISLTRLAVVELAPVGILSSLGAALAAILNARGRFQAAILVLAFEPLCKTAFVVGLGSKLGMQALIAGNMVGICLADAALAFLVGRSGLCSLDLRPNLASPFVRSVLRLSIPILVSNSVLEINPVIDRTLAAPLGPGRVTALELGVRLFGVPAAMLTTTLVGPITATWAARKVEQGWPGLRDSLHNAIRGVAVVVPTLVIVLIALRGPLLGVIYQGGAYSPLALHETTAVFAILLVSLPAQVVTVFFVTLFIVQGDAALPMKIGIANVVLNFGLDLFLRPVAGLNGIAWSTTITWTLVAVAYAVFATLRWKDLGIAQHRASYVRAAASALVVAVCGNALVFALGPASTRLQQIGVVVVVGAACIAVHVAILLAGKEPLVVDALTRLRRLAPGGAT